MTTRYHCYPGRRQRLFVIAQRYHMNRQRGAKEDMPQLPQTTGSAQRTDQGGGQGRAVMNWRVSWSWTSQDGAMPVRFLIHDGDARFAGGIDAPLKIE